MKFFHSAWVFLFFQVSYSSISVDDIGGSGAIQEVRFQSERSELCAVGTDCDGLFIYDCSRHDCSRRILPDFCSDKVRSLSFNSVRRILEVKD